MKQTKSSRIMIAAFLVLPIIHLLVFSYVPIISNVILSFTNYRGTGTPRFIGLSNYKRLLTDPQYTLLFKNCLWYMLVAIPQLVFAFALSIFVNGKFRGLGLFKGILIIPYLLNGVIVSTIFIIFFNNSGTLNTILNSIGLGALTHQWLQDLKLVNPAIASISIWRYFGQNFIMFFGALQTVPAIKNVLFINILLSISGSIQVFEIPYIMMNGSNGTTTPVIQIQQSAFADNRLGFAAALSILVFVVVVISVGLQSIFNKKAED